jgi:hypothetical protein
MIGGTIGGLVAFRLRPLLIPFLLSRSGRLGPLLLLLGVYVVLKTEGGVEEV